LAILLSGQIFMSDFPLWVWHLLAGSYGLALGLTGAIRYRGWVVKTLGLIAPPAFAVLGSWVLLKESGQKGVPSYTWFGTMAALSGAATGLLAGFSSRSVGGFAAGVIGGQVVAWPAGVLFFAALRTRMPYGLVVPMAFALASGLTHLVIAYALRWAKADHLPANKGRPKSKSQNQ